MEMITQIAPLLMNLDAQELLAGTDIFSTTPMEREATKGELVFCLVTLYCEHGNLQPEILEWAMTQQTMRPFEVEMILGINKELRWALTSKEILPVARKTPMKLYGREIMVPLFDYADIFKLRGDREFQARLQAEKLALEDESAE